MMLLKLNGFNFIGVVIGLKELWEKRKGQVLAVIVGVGTVSFSQDFFVQVSFIQAFFVQAFFIQAFFITVYPSDLIHLI